LIVWDGGDGDWRDWRVDHDEEELEMTTLMCVSSSMFGKDRNTLSRSRSVLEQSRVLRLKEEGVMSWVI